MITDSTLLGYATDFLIALDGKTVTISRYTNHRRLIDDRKWAVAYKHEWFLGEDGYWHYKRFAAFDSAQDAVAALLVAQIPGTFSPDELPEGMTA